MIFSAFWSILSMRVADADLLALRVERRVAALVVREARGVEAVAVARLDHEGDAVGIEGVGAVLVLRASYHLRATSSI